MFELHRVPSYIASQYVLDTESLEGDLSSIIAVEWNSVDFASSTWSVHYSLSSYSTKGVANFIIGKLVLSCKSFIY